MLNKLVSIAILAFFCALSINEISAQEKAKEQKVVIIEKEVNADGKVTEKKVVKTGAEAEAYLKQMEKEDGEEQIWVTDDGKEINVTGKKMMMVKKEAYEIQTEDENGQVKIMKWDGEGEMPAEMKELMEKEGVDISAEMDGTKKSRIKVKRKGAGDEEVMDFEFEGDELPQDVKDILEKEGIDIEEVIKGNGMKEIKVTARGGETDSKATPKKAQLGVNIEAHPSGVMVSQVIAESSAALAGLIKGDIITQVDGVQTKEVLDLVNKISEYKPEDKVELTFLRNGKTETKSVILKERIDPYPHKSWDSVMKNGKKAETIEIEVETEISKGKKN